MIGNIGIASTNPDRGYIDVVNTLFGGRFTSLFNTELRIKSGYSYGAFSYFNEHARARPLHHVDVHQERHDGTRHRQDPEVLGRLHKDGFTPEEIASAKTYINGTLPPRYETTPQSRAP